MSFGITSKYEGKEVRCEMNKKGHVRTNWNKRYFVLDFPSKKLQYFVNSSREVEKGRYLLDSESTAVAAPDEGKHKYIIHLTARTSDSADKNSLFISAEGASTRDQWLEFFNVTYCFLVFLFCSVLF